MPQLFSVRPYTVEHRAGCLRLIDANTPTFFAPEERAAYDAFLSEHAAQYRVCLDNGQVIGAFGLIGGGTEARALRWMMIDPGYHGRGMGTAIMSRVKTLARAATIPMITIATSQHTAPFFARFGAREVTVTEHGWGPDMHRHDMELTVE